MAEAISSCPPPAACRPAAVRAVARPASSAWPGASLAVVRRWFADARRRRAAIRELQRLPDDQLRDIGIARDGIAVVVDMLMAREA